jgi:hypothetical protein
MTTVICHLNRAWRLFPTHARTRYPASEQCRGGTKLIRFEAAFIESETDATRRGCRARHSRLPGDRRTVERDRDTLKQGTPGIDAQARPQRWRRLTPAVSISPRSNSRFQAAASRSSNRCTKALSQLAVMNRCSVARVIPTYSNRASSSDLSILVGINPMPAIATMGNSSPLLL